MIQHKVPRNTDVGQLTVMTMKFTNTEMIADENVGFVAPQKHNELIRSMGLFAESRILENLMDDCCPGHLIRPTLAVR